MPGKARIHRPADERIAELEAKIADIRARAERRKAKADPTVRLVLTATRALDKALSEAKAGPMREAIEQAREALKACLAPQGLLPTRKKRSTTAAPQQPATERPRRVRPRLPVS